MGRRKLYHTKEEKAAAAAARSAQYYERNKGKICSARKAKYIPKPSRPKLPAMTLTEDERKVKNRLKSKLYYERNKSTVKRVRQAKKPKCISWSFLRRTNPCSHTIWNKGLSNLNDQATEALKKESVPDFVDGVALQYIETGLRGPLDDASKPFLEIMLKLDVHEQGFLNDVGAGAHLGDIRQVREYLQHIVDLLEHLVLIALETEDAAGFLEVYKMRGFMHHTLYF